MELANCCTVAAPLPVYLMLGWAWLRGGCGLYNRLVGKGSPERVREPTFLRALGIQLAAFVAGFVAALLLSALRAVGEDGFGFDGEAMRAVALLQAAPLGLIALGAILALFLPTTFSRGLLAAMCCLLLVACVGAVIVAVFFAIYALSLLGR
jgi:hypothetical protein